MALFRVDHDLCVPCPPEDLPWPWQSPDRYQWFAEAEDMIDWPTEGPSLHRLRDGWWFDAGGPAYPGAPDESGWMFAGRTVKNALRFVDDEYIRRWERDEDGEAPRHATDPTNPDYPITLGRRTDELVPRVHAVCPACAAALRSTSDTHLPVYARIGDPPEAFVASVRFPPELLALALMREEELAKLPRQPTIRLEIRNTRHASRGRR